MKTISVLLTKYSDSMSTLIYCFTGFGYTHASIALEEDDHYYSFNYHGFVVETLEKHRKRGVTRSLCYEIEVSDESYALIKEEIDRFKATCEAQRYSPWGVVFAVLRIPHFWNNRYFCSQFVARLLIESRAIPLQRKPSVYLPNQFLTDLARCSGLKQTIYNVI